MKINALVNYVSDLVRNRDTMCVFYSIRESNIIHFVHGSYLKVESRGRLQYSVHL